MIRKVIAGFALALAIVAVAAQPASAHAQLLSTEPSNGAVLTQAPQQIVLHFGEPVEISLGSLKVFDANAGRVDKGSPHHLSGDSRSAGTDVGRLPDGGYVATWRVISADSHPVHGAFTFQVGNTNVNTDSLAQRLVTQGKGDASVGVVYAIGRAAVIAGFVMLLGAVAFVLFVAEEAWGLPRFRSITWAACALLGLASMAAFLLESVYAAALPLTRIFDFPTMGALINTRFGVATMVRLGLLALIGALLFRFGLVRGRRRDLVMTALIVGLILTLSLAGHAGTGRLIPTAICLDLVHVFAASAWTGGLIILVILWRSEPSESIERFIPKFSSLAYDCVIAITVTGTLQGWRQLGTFGALFHTPYGQLLILKVGIVAGIVFSGWQARRHLSVLRRVHNSVRIEAALAVLVFGVTSLLTNAAPEASTSNKPFTGEVRVADHLVDMIVDPSRPGPDSIHLYVLTDTGVPTDVPDVTASLTLASRNIGPIPIPLAHIASGHFDSLAFTIPISGNWRMDLSVRTSDIDVSTGSITVPIK